MRSREFKATQFIPKKVLSHPKIEVHWHTEIKEFMGQDSKLNLLLETSIPGIFAAGDVRDKSIKQVVSAAGEDGSAASMIREYLKGM